MISLAPLSSASDAASYYAKDNYYTADQGESSSSWAGQGAEELGLSGPVDTKAFEAVLKGELPNGTVLDGKRGDHRPGWDVTMSASKSVSLLALIGGDQRLVAAVREAAVATVNWVEKSLAESRVSVDGQQRPERTGNLVIATFLHDVNRAEEPQLHVHNPIVNATRTSDGKWHALHGDELYRRQHVMDAVFQAYLRWRVEALGYTTVKAKNGRNGAFEIKGVSRAVIEAFSVRSSEINAYLKENGLKGTPAEREIAARATRSPKAPVLSPEQRAEGWRALAEQNGLDAKGLIEAAIARAERGETVWTRVVEGLRGAGEKGLAFAARMGLTPRDGDALVPERLGRLEPRAYAAAQAVASAVRDLGEREAAYHRLEIVRVALARRGPILVSDVEARIDLLTAKGRLIASSGLMVTTEGARALEQAHLDAVRAGQGQSAAMVPVLEAPARAQEAARELGLRRLNPGQAAAASLILSSSDRVVNVQGAAGRGKSAALAPVVAIARAEGRTTLAVSSYNTTARELGQKTDAPWSTLAKLLGQHRRVIDGKASPADLAKSVAELGGAVLLLDEASQVGTYDMERLVRLANLTGMARLVLTGDKDQTGAIGSGKPFQQSQEAGHATAHLTENLRSASPMMKTVTAALERGDVSGAFNALRPATIEVPRGGQPAVAARLWAAMETGQRDETLLIASGRAMRSAANQAAQAELKAAGEIDGRGVRVAVLDRVTMTREHSRQIEAYEQGRIVEFRTNLRTQGFGQGEQGVVMDVVDDRVRIRTASGEIRDFRPDKLPKNLKYDAVSVFEWKEVELHRGDRIRWTDSDHGRGLLNGDLARVEEVGGGKLVASSLADGTVHEIGRDDRMLRRLDLAYAVNVHIAQGMTIKNGIMMMSSGERNLNTRKVFVTAATRISESPKLVVDDGRKIERAINRNPGDKTSALEVAAGARESGASGKGDIRSPIDHALGRYTRAFSASEAMREPGEAMSPGQQRELAQAAAVLDRVRPNGAEDLQIVLDRRPELTGPMTQDRSGEVRQAWMDEGRTRADPRAYAERFVEDWREASVERGEAKGWRAEERVERRLGRLTDRMNRDPLLEIALDKAIPERHRSADEQGRGGLVRDRDRDFDMGR
ncbi:MAG TPA: MobF family relaxase [Sphingomonas sp.]